MGAFADALGSRADEGDSASSPSVPDSFAPGRPRVMIRHSEPVSEKKETPFAAALANKDQPVASFSDRFSASKRQVGTGEALGRGIASGVTANFYDELRGLHEAGGSHPDEPMSLSSVLRGAVGRMSGDKAAVQKYEEAVAREREINKLAEEQHPAASLAGNVAGGLALPVGGAAAATTKIGRAAYGSALGAGYGAAFGAGEGDGIADRATRAAGGAVLGGAIGGAAPTVIDAAGKVVSTVSHGAGSILGHPIDTFNAWRNPEGEAIKRIGGALQQDIEAGKAGMSPADILAAKQNGQSIAAVDLGGENVRAVGRSAANTSPSGRAVLDDMTSQRFESQSDRASNFVRGLSPFGGSAPTTGDALQAAASAANKPAYARAFSDGQNIPFDSRYQKLMHSPDVQDAMREATRTAANSAASQGFQPVKNPFVFSDGQLPQLSGAAKPNLQYWNAVKINLDNKINKLKREGGFTGDLVSLKNQLVANLDNDVASYKAARSGAAAYFGAEDALDAGRKFVTMTGSIADARAAFNKMNSAQKSLFSEGFVSDLADKISKISDNRSITIDKIFNSKDGRERINLALGTANATKLETFLRVEDMHDMARKMLGNSTTVRQAIEAHLAGGLGKTLTSSTVGGLAAGAQAYSSGQIDSKTVLTFALAGGISGGRAYINTKLAQRIGELLASHKTEDLVAVTRMASNNPQIGRAIRHAETVMEKLGGQRVPNNFLPGSPMPVAAQDDQNK